MYSTPEVPKGSQDSELAKRIPQLKVTLLVEVIFLPLKISTCLFKTIASVVRCVDLLEGNRLNGLCLGKSPLWVLETEYEIITVLCGN